MKLQHNGGAKTPYSDDALVSELVSAASLVSANLAVLERLGQSHASHALTWPYIRKILATTWPGEEPK